jgi:ABC-2 type transport system ATP-binding protein
MKVLEALSLSKVYGSLKAVDNLSIAIGEGEIYGFIGLNGAGKTTTIRMFLNMIKPSAGTVQLFGKQLKSGDQLLNSIGYLVETPSAYPELTVAENIQIYSQYRNLNDDSLVEPIIHKLQLYNYRNVKSKHLSLGNKQRLGLAKAMFHNPKLLILDEPTNGLDPAGIVEFRNMLKDLASQGITVFISSHLLDEVSRIATRIGIVHQGKLVREINSKQLDDELLRNLVINARQVEKCKTLLSSSGYDFSFDVHTNVFSSTSDNAVDDVEQIVKQLAAADVGLQEAYIDKEDLESYFLRQIEREVNHG